MDYIEACIRTIPDFPKKGIMFRDITTLLSNPKAFNLTCLKLKSEYQWKEINYVAGIEARGFIFGSVLARDIGAGFIPIRKKGKLPGKTISEEYKLEYGTDEIEIDADTLEKGDKVLIIDDLLATGGTARAACNLIENTGAEVIECAFVVELPRLRGRHKLKNKKVFSLIMFEGE